MTEPAFEDIETFCPQSRRQAVIQMQVIKKSPAMVLGIPKHCQFDFQSCRKTCSCLLNAYQILIRRKKA